MTEKEGIYFRERMDYGYLCEQIGRDDMLSDLLHDGVISREIYNKYVSKAAKGGQE